MLTNQKPNELKEVTQFKLNRNAQVKKAFHCRLGQNTLYDQQSSQYIHLPVYFTAMPVAPGTFIGGSSDGQIYLKVMSCSTEMSALPDKFCHEDAGLLLTSKKENAHFFNANNGGYYTGTLRKDSVNAYIQMFKTPNGTPYLLTLACKTTIDDIDLRMISAQVVHFIMQMKVAE